MYQMISKVNNTVNLQENIANRDGVKRVGLRSFTYTLGWYNVTITYNTIQISLLHSGHTNMTYEEYNTILKGGTCLLDR